MKNWFKFIVYKNKEENKFSIHWIWNIPHIPLERIDYAKTTRLHQLVICGTDNLYWIFNKNQNGGYKFFHKTINDHCDCSG